MSTPASSSPLPPGPSQLGRSLLLVGVIAAAFSGALQVPFFGDDRDAVLLNETIRSLSTSLSPPNDTPVAGRPVPNLSLALNHALGGLSPLGYHLGNLLIHVVNALLVGSLAQRLAARRLEPVVASWVGLLVGLLWGLHPLHTEVVAYVNVRTESLAALAVLTVLWLWERADATGNRAWAWAAVPVSLVGMGCKEHVMLLPLVVLLVDRTLLAGSFRGALQARGAAAWLALVATSGWSLRTVLTAPWGGSIGAGLGVSPLQYLMTQSQVIWHYLGLCFAPLGLQHKYDWAIVTDPATIVLPFAGLALLAAATGLALWRRPLWGLAGAWFFLWLAPSSSVIPIVTEVAADRRMYLPSLAVIAALGLALAPLLRRAPAVVLGMGLVAATALGVRTADRLRDYRDVLTLSESLLAADPDNLPAHKALGPLYYVEGQPERARLHLETVLAEKPDHVASHYFLARIALDEGRPELAVPHLQAVVGSPGAPDDAAALLDEALRSSSAAPPAHPGR